MDIRGLPFGRLSTVSQDNVHGQSTDLIPTPPAMKSSFLMDKGSTLGGGHVKLPPTLMNRGFFNNSFSLCHSHAAGGLPGDRWIASSKYSFSSKSRGVEVMVKPPACGTFGVWTSSHCPGRNYIGEISFWLDNPWYMRPLALIGLESLVVKGLKRSKRTLA